VYRGFRYFMRPVEPVYSKTREFLGSTGRMKYLKPLYTALFDHPKSRTLALEIFEEHKRLYHVIARRGVETLLGLGG